MDLDLDLEFLIVTFLEQTVVLGGGNWVPSETTDQPH